MKRSINHFLIKGKVKIHSRILILLVLLSCDFQPSEKAEIYEAAIRHHIQGLQSDSIVLVLSIDGEDVIFKNRLTENLSDLEYKFILSEEYILPEEYISDKKYPIQMSLKIIRRPSIQVAVVQLSVFSPPYNGYSADYTIDKIGENWVVTKKGNVRMT